MDEGRWARVRNALIIGSIAAVLATSAAGWRPVAAALAAACGLILVGLAVTVGHTGGRRLEWFDFAPVSASIGGVVWLFTSPQTAAECAIAAWFGLLLLFMLRERSRGASQASGRP